MERTDATTARRLARTAGLLYLLNILGGFFAIGLVPAALVMTGDLAATAEHIQADPMLYRFGLVAHILVTVTNVPLAVIFFDLFKVVNRRVALLVAAFTLVGTAVEAGALIDQFTVLTLLGSGRYASAFSPQQLHALAYLPIDMNAIAYSLYTVFFGLNGFSLGYLVFRSTFLPRLVGVLLVIGAVAYLTAAFSTFLAPAFAAQLFPYVGLPSLLGEGSFCVSLLVIGVNVERWRARAAEIAPAPIA